MLRRRGRGFVQGAYGGSLPLVETDLDSSNNFTSGLTSWTTANLVNSPGGNRLFLLWVHQEPVTVPSGVTYGGNAMTLAISSGWGPNTRTSLWYLLEDDIPTSPATATITFSDTSNQHTGRVIAWTVANVDQISPFGAIETWNQGSTSSWGGNITPAVDNSTVYGLIAHTTTGQNHTPTSGQTEVFETTSGPTSMKTIFTRKTDMPASLYAASGTFTGTVVQMATPHVAISPIRP